MGRSAKEQRLKGMAVKGKGNDPLKDMPDLDPVEEAKRRAKLKKQQEK